MPLLRSKEAVGVISAYSSQEEAFHDDDKRLLEAIATSLARVISVDSHRLLAVATTDALTGLPHLRHLYGLVGPEEDLCKQFSLPVSVLCVCMNLRSSTTIEDVDILYITGALRSQTRGGDLLLRLEPTEFLMLLPNTDRAGAIAVSDRILDSSMHAAQTNSQLRQCLLIGSSTAPADGSSLRELVAKAKERQTHGSSRRERHIPHQDALGIH